MERFPPHRVTVAVDLTGPSLSALDAARALARRWGSQLRLVHVESPALPLLAGVESGPVFPTLPPARVRRLRHRLRAALVGFPPERSSVRVLAGGPVEVLSGLARPEETDLLVLGSHGYHGVDRLALGSVSEEVVRRARVPVLVVHERRAPVRVARVLAPWNGAPYSLRALRYAREAAHSLGASLCVLSVIPYGSAIEDRCRELRSRLELVLGTGADWTLRVRLGEAREHILRELEYGGHGLVVLSAHRRGLTPDLAMGSTLERVLRHSRVPVLAVPSAPHSWLQAARAPATWAGSRLFAV